MCVRKGIKKEQEPLRKNTHIGSKMRILTVASWKKDIKSIEYLQDNKKHCICCRPFFVMPLLKDFFYTALNILCVRLFSFATCCCCCMLLEGSILLLLKNIIYIKKIIKKMKRNRFLHGMVKKQMKIKPWCLHTYITDIFILL